MMFCPALLPCTKHCLDPALSPFPTHHISSHSHPPCSEVFPWKLSEKCSLHPSLPYPRGTALCVGTHMSPWLLLIRRVTSVPAVQGARGHQAGAARDSFHPQFSPDRIWQHQDPISEVEHWPFHSGAFSTGRMWRDGAHPADTQHFISPPASRGEGEGRHQHIC